MKILNLIYLLTNMENIQEKTILKIITKYMNIIKFQRLPERLKTEKGHTGNNFRNNICLKYFINNGNRLCKFILNS